MSTIKNQQPSSSPNSSLTPNRIPGCLWVLLGAGLTLVLLTVAFLLIFAPGIRRGSFQVNPTVKQIDSTQTVPASATFTPWITQTAAVNQQETATPTPYQEAETPPGNPDDLQVSTPASRAGCITIAPYLTADAMHYSLEVGQDLNLDWVEFPPGAAQYQILLIPDGNGTELILIEDDNPQDGIGGVWQVPENIGGEVQGRAVFSDGRTVTSVSGGWIYSRHKQ